jgi:hypothetical protein
MAQRWFGLNTQHYAFENSRQSDRTDVMKRVFASQKQAAIAIVRELLANEGIGTTIINESCIDQTCDFCGHAA